MDISLMMLDHHYGRKEFYASLANRHELVNHFLFDHHYPPISSFQPAIFTGQQDIYRTPVNSASIRRKQGYGSPGTHVIL
jgi:hypothetical protein